MYEDLRRKQPAGSSSRDDRQLDLFTSYQPMPPSPEQAPPRMPECKPLPDTPVSETPASPVFRRGLERNAPLVGVIEPLSRLPPLRNTRLVKWHYALLVMAAAALGIGGILGLRSCTRQRASAPDKPSGHEATTVTSAETSVAPAKPAVVPSPIADRPPSSTPAQAGAPPSKPTTVSRPSTPAAPTFRLPGAKVTTVGQVHIFVFEDGIFLGATRIKPQAAEALRALAKQLVPYGPRVSVTVIGCTDNISLNPGSRFRDNTELGLARAREVANFMKSVGPLPSAEFQILSFGERWAPHPNDTPQNRNRNRTVVLRISVKD